MDRRYLLTGVLVVLLAAHAPARAGSFWNKKTKPTPAEYVPELIKTLKSDGDEHKRSAAAEELRQYDPQQFPEIIPALVDSLLNDKKPSVRAEVAQTIGRLRPVNAAAGAALEQSLAKDSSMRVRLQARSSLLQYRWAGYVPKTKDEPTAQSKEPPLAPPLPAPAAPVPAPVPAVILPSAPRAIAVATPVKRTQPAPEPAKLDSAKPAGPSAPPAKTDDDKGPDLSPP